MRVAILGGSGLLGGHLIEQGLSRGHELIVISRKFPQRSAAQVYHDRLTLKALDATELKASDLDGVELLVNAAAIVSSSSDESIIEKNLELVKTIFLAAREAKVRKLVHVSSVSTMANGTQDLVSEKDHGKFRDTVYARSKYLCDQWLAETFQDSDLLTIHPCYMLGKWDAKPSSGAILLALQLRRLPGFWPGVKNFVHAGDVARGLFEAAEAGLSGRYLLGGENVTFKTFFEHARKALGLEFELPELKREELENQSALKEFFLANPVDDSKARMSWGYVPRTQLDGMLEETIAYLRDSKLLPRLRK